MIKQFALELNSENRNVQEENYNLLRSLLTDSPIHAGILYTNNGKKLNQTLCLLLSGTKSSRLYGNWEDFANALGLATIIIQCIKYDLMQQDSTTYVLLAFVQKEDPTIEKILKALYEIKRYDILQQIKPYVEKINQSKENFSIDNTEISTVIQSLRSPFIFKDLERDDQMLDLKFPSITPAIVENLRENNIIIKNLQKCVQPETLAVENKNSVARITPNISERSYDVTIFLTYTSDAIEIAKHITKYLRITKNVKIGVLVLNEHFTLVSESPEEFIFNCFMQVDYIFPIVTHNYLTEVTEKNEEIMSSTSENYDHKYAKYIYKMMMTHFIRQGCRNKKVGCVIPDKEIHQVKNHHLMNHPLFQVWVRLSEVDKLINAILAKVNR